VKRFILLPTSKKLGILYDDERGISPAMLLTPQEAKFMATFRGVRESQQ
jgi:hypothetical protein